jgi:hypothetical protein
MWLMATLAFVKAQIFRYFWNVSFTDFHLYFLKIKLKLHYQRENAIDKISAVPSVNFHLKFNLRAFNVLLANPKSLKKLAIFQYKKRKPSSNKRQSFLNLF